MHTSSEPTIEEMFTLLQELVHLKGAVIFLCALCATLPLGLCEDPKNAPLSSNQGQIQGKCRMPREGRFYLQDLLFPQRILVKGQGVALYVGKLVIHFMNALTRRRDSVVFVVPMPTCLVIMPSVFTL